jgi:hypothetical protein
VVSTIPPISGHLLHRGSSNSLPSAIESSPLGFFPVAYDDGRPVKAATQDEIRQDS